MQNNSSSVHLRSLHLFPLGFCHCNKDISYKMKFIFLLVIVVPLANCDRIVTTNNGPVKGKYLTEKKVEAFLGIPYAEPPEGSLRFAKPVPKSSWKETYEADDLPPACVQSTLEGFEFAIDKSKKMSEDCLYLNLWVPEGGNNLKPIMVFIHGGGFLFGSSNMNIINGATLAEHGDVIVATINYRVGTLGFFSGFINEAAGNMGMYDQLMAIQWIKDNAKNFGGDPDNIVLFGESAGAVSVSLHMISPLSKNLFRRGILQSASAFHPLYSDGNEGLSMGSQMIASVLGCANENEVLKNNPKSVIDCMKSLPAEKFPEADRILFQKFGFGVLNPRVGDDFLPVNPIDTFRKGDFNSEVLLGINRDEGSLILTASKPEIFGPFGEKVDAAKFNETSAKEILQALMKMDDDNIIIQSYLDRVKDGSRYTYLNAMSDAFGDFFITCGTVYQADYQSLKDNPVYFYLFDYRSPSSPFAEWMGVAHFEEVPYVFGNPFLRDFSEYEKELSKDIMEMWAAFAKTGNPSIPGGLKWPRYTYKDPKYFIIGQRDSVGVRPDNYRCEAWRDFFRSVINDEDIQHLKNSSD